jgi:serine protease Do
MYNEQQFITQADRYLRGEMAAEERLAFEQYLQAQPEQKLRLDEHRLFIEQLHAFDARKRMEQSIQKAKSRYQSGLGARKTSLTNGKVVSMWDKWKSAAGVAAAVAIFSVFTTLWLSGYYSNLEKSSTNYSELRRDMNKVKQNVNAQNAAIRNMSNEKSAPQTATSFGATGFLISSAGYVVTNHHVVQGADSIYLENSQGESFKTKILYVDPQNDLAVLYIEDPSYKKLKTIPYTFKESYSDLGEEVYTIGFPRDEAVYGQGYVSSKSGYAGDTTAYQVAIPVNPGNSGGPLLDTKGQVIGMISGKQTGIDGASFAIKTKTLVQSLAAIPQDSLNTPLHLNKKNALQGLKRTEQIKRIQDYVYMVKVY